MTPDENAPRSSESESPGGEPLGQNRDGDVNFASTDGSDLTSGTPTADDIQGQPPIPRDVRDAGESNVGSPPDEKHAR